MDTSAIEGMPASVIAELADEKVTQNIKLAARQFVKQGYGEFTFEFQFPGGATLWAREDEFIRTTVTITII